jgi:hypothetical protein
MHTARPYNPAEFQGDYLSPVRGLHAFVNERMRPFLTHAFLHGSLADGTYRIGWSDMDTLFMLRPDADYEAYVELEREALGFLAQIDPLHHHGFIYRGIPGVVIDHAVSLLDGAETVDVVDRSRFDAIEALEERRWWLAKAVETGVYEHHAYHGEYLKAEWANADNAMYQLKYLLEGVMNLPAYLAEILGRPVYKGDSFNLVRPVMPRPPGGLLDKASLVRKAWPTFERHPYEGNSVPGWVREYLGPDYLREALALTDEVLEIAKVAA